MTAPPVSIKSRIGARVSRAATQLLARKTADLTGKPPIVSFTFDDFPQSALEVGGQILEDNGVRGTYYACFGLAETDSPGGRIGNQRDLAHCAERGHELGCHTFSHVMPQSQSKGELERDIRRNQDTARALGQRMLNFAYPFGVTNLASKRACGGLYRSARTVEWGVNRGRSDLRLLKSVTLYSRVGTDVCERYIEEAVRTPGWLIFCTHDVAADASPYGCTHGEFERIVKSACRAGVQVLPVNQALDYLGVPA
jgi:peptidoglycan/xylan/chitin deacetylase (PgdA/CDA1 family)